MKGKIIWGTPACDDAAVVPVSLWGTPTCDDAAVVPLLCNVFLHNIWVMANYTTWNKNTN